MTALYQDFTAWKAIGHIRNEQRRKKRQSGKKKQQIRTRYTRYFEEAANGQGENMVLPGMPGDDGTTTGGV